MKTRAFQAGIVITVGACVLGGVAAGIVYARVLVSDGTLSGDPTGVTPGPWAAVFVPVIGAVVGVALGVVPGLAVGGMAAAVAVPGRRPAVIRVAIGLASATIPLVVAGATGAGTSRPTSMLLDAADNRPLILWTTVAAVTLVVAIAVSIAVATIVRSAPAPVDRWPPPHAGGWPPPTTQ